MRVSDAITSTHKSALIEAATKKLIALAQHPRLKELLMEIRLSSIGQEQCVRYGLLGSPKKFSDTTSVLKFTSKGFLEKTTRSDNYGYTTHGLDLAAAIAPSRTGGTEKTTKRIIPEQELPNLPEKYDLDHNALQKIIDRMEL